LADQQQLNTQRKSQADGQTAKKPRSAPKHQRSTFLVRNVLASDQHAFVGRIFDLGIIQMHFETYDELARHPDCKYAFDLNIEVTSIVRRVESLNLAGDLLWPESLPRDFRKFPISRHEWLTVAADVFLMRYVSVVDCAMLLVNSVFELGLKPKQCSIDNLRKAGAPGEVIGILEGMIKDQGDLRQERNARFHHGAERGFTDDNEAFRITALMEHRWGGVDGGKDRFGRKLDMERMFKKGLVELQREFNRATRRLVRQLDRLYDQLWPAFEARFGPRIQNSTHGLRMSRKR
jgi:hypothetical protein